LANADPFSKSFYWRIPEENVFVRQEVSCSP